ncbi:MAG: septum site-determining protein MinC [Pseudomonadota bacterium]|nr:septum site-determining protein MinC [Pseudomonadota bacterium]
MAGLKLTTEEQINATVICIQSTKAEYLETMISQANLSGNTIYVILDLKKISTLESPAWFRNIRSFMKQYNMVLIGVRDPQLNLEICKSLKIPVIDHTPHPNHSKNPTQAHPPTETLNKSIDGPIRSGQQVYAEKSSLIIRGNISAGAEVASANDVHIYGACHGKILAGVTGNDTARIYLKSGFPELVSIAGITLHSEEINPINQDTMFMITNGQLSQHLL